MLSLTEKCAAAGGSLADRRAAAPALVRLEPGAFLMGGSGDDKFVTDTERPAHRVAIASAFALGRFPVTVGEYRAFSPGHSPTDEPGWPAVNVSWDDARGYCAWLGAETGEWHRLPTEAEWEFACRAGSRSPFAGGEEITTGTANFLYSEDGQRIGPGHRTPVGRYPSNAFGLSDLHGNVCEWVEDAWHPGYAGSPCDGSAWSEGGDGRLRVIRGGAWDYLPRLLRSAWRDSLPRGHRRDNLGFRIARTLPP
ncbi:MAG TPA: formylglycine-generating enzyme family protein [Opitutaceae bacterium]